MAQNQETEKGLSVSSTGAFDLDKVVRLWFKRCATG